MLRTALNALSPAGGRARLSVLVLHRVLPGPDPLYPEALDAARFHEVCGWMKSMFNVLALDDAVRRLQRGALPERAAAITFDDGYADNLHVALPVLRGAGLPATVFITTGFLDGGCMWNDVVIESFRRTTHSRAVLADLLPQLPEEGRFELANPLQRRHAIETTIKSVKYLEPTQRLAVVQELARRLAVTPPTDLMLTSAEVPALRAGGLQVGAHTVSHPILTRLKAEDMRREIQESKAGLERILNEPVTLFAYPNGRPGDDYDEQAVAAVRELGFEAAFTTVNGAAHAGTDPLQIPRFTPWDRTRLRFGLRMLSTLWASRPGGAAPGAAQPVLAAAPQDGGR